MHRGLGGRRAAKGQAIKRAVCDGVRQKGGAFSLMQAAIGREVRATAGRKRR